MWLGSNSAAAGQTGNLRSASRHVSRPSQRRRVTVVIDSQLELMSARWPPCVAVATTTTAAPTGRQVYVSRGRKDAGPLQAFISCRLEPQLTVLRHRRGSDEPATVCPECSCTSGVRRSTVRPHHDSATGAATQCTGFRFYIGWI